MPAGSRANRVPFVMSLPKFFNAGTSSSARRWGKHSGAATRIASCGAKFSACRLAWRSPPLCHAVRTAGDGRRSLPCERDLGPCRATSRSGTMAAWRGPDTVSRFQRSAATDARGTWRRGASRVLRPPAASLAGAGGTGRRRRDRVGVSRAAGCPPARARNPCDRRSCRSSPLRRTGTGRARLPSPTRRGGPASPWRDCRARTRCRCTS